MYCVYIIQVGGDHTVGVHIYLWNLPLWEETILGEFHLPLEPSLVGGDHTGGVHIYLWNLPLWEETILGEFTFTSGTFPCGRRPYWESSHLPLEPSLLGGDHTGRVHIYLWNLPLWEETILAEFTFTSGTFPCGRIPYWESFTFTSGTFPCGRKPYWESSHLPLPSGTFPCGRRPYWGSSHLPLEPSLVGGTTLGEFTFTSGTFPCGRRPYWTSSHLPLEPPLVGRPYWESSLWNLPLWEETILGEFTFTSGTFPCGRRPYWESSRLPLEPSLVGGDHTGRVHIYLWNLRNWQ